jgi:DNA (cytosine-5)-methyltransferase 1|nr:MAG: C-5 cytosine-specific DNA methylase [Bacteriophage sp.]DAF71795.1 MAG TPA: DNA cytosine methyltransferase [Caudoviricetes sp.]
MCTEYQKGAGTYPDKRRAGFLLKKMIHGELIVDNFAGGGGASTGIEMATGYSVDIAINHDPEAIKMHKANHPNTKHYCENVWAVDPVKACNGHPVGLAWFSPDCKHFSKAKGGKPKDKNIRGLAWVACRWAGLVRPRVIMLENVEEFKTWGPLNRGHHPIKAKQGKTFEKFVQQLNDLGYTVEFKELIAADYGAPTMRKRFFLIARCDGKPIVWPEPTHAPADSEAVKAGLVKPYVGAYTQLDFSLPCPSIFDTSEEIKEKYGIRAVRPLAQNTMDRIARGFIKFVLNNPKPFIIQCNHGGERRPNDIREPMPTITGKHGYGIVEPYMVQIGQTGFTKDRSKDVREPLTTIVSKNEHCLIEPTLAPYMGKNTTNHPGGNCKDPIHTITTGNQQCLISPTLIQYHSETSKDGVRGQTIKDPIMTVDSSNRYGLVASFLHKYYDGGYKGAGETVENPLPTVTAWDHNSVVTANLIQMNNHCDGKDIRQPLPTITAGDGHFGEVRAFLIKYYGQGTGQDIKDPLDTVTAQDRFGLVTINGTDYQIVDIGLRMLEPRELYGCQGFPDDYIIDHDYTGKTYPRSEQVRRCGNAVCPPIPAALVRANLPEFCVAERMPNMQIEAEQTGQLRFA